MSLNTAHEKVQSYCQHLALVNKTFITILLSNLNPPLLYIIAGQCL